MPVAERQASAPGLSNLYAFAGEVREVLAFQDVGQTQAVAQKSTPLSGSGLGAIIVTKESNDAYAVERYWTDQAP